MINVISTSSGSAELRPTAKRTGRRTIADCLAPLFPRRKCGDEHSVGAHRAELAGASGRAERLIPARQRLGEKLRVLGRVHPPPLPHVILVVDRLHWAHRL